MNIQKYIFFEYLFEYSTFWVFILSNIQILRILLNIQDIYEYSWYSGGYDPQMLMIHPADNVLLLKYA